MSLNKVKNYCEAAIRLKDGLEDYQAYSLTTMQDGVIKRFELALELAWKSLEEYMVDQGVSEQMNVPEQVLKEAYASKLISDHCVWLDMLDARNTTSLIYNDRQATQIMNDIQSHFLPHLLALADFYLET